MQPRWSAWLAEIEDGLWTGAAWPGVTVAEVAKAAAALSDLYTVERGVLVREQGDRGHLLAKCLFFLASDAPKVALALAECAERDRRFAAPTSVLDVGCGVGATSVGLLLALGLRGVRQVRLTGVDHAPAVLEQWVRHVRLAAAVIGIEVTLRTFAEDALHHRPAPDTDLVLCQTALNERLPGNRAGEIDHDRATEELVRGWATTAPTLVVEPALRSTTRALQRLRDRLLADDALDVVAPCPHRSACPMLPSERDWCHESRRFPPSPRVEAVQAITRRRDDRLLFSFLALAPRAAAAPSGDGCLWRLVSDPLGSRGKTERWVCCDDGRLRQVRVLDRERRPSNELLVEGERGTLVRLPTMPPSDRIAPDQVVTRAFER